MKENNNYRRSLMCITCSIINPFSYDFGHLEMNSSHFHLPYLSAEYYLQLSSDITGRSCGLHKHILTRRFRALFGVPPSSCPYLWSKVIPFIPFGKTPRHVLFGLLFLKTYANNHIHSALCGVTEKHLENRSGLLYSHCQGWTWHVSNTLYF